MMSRALIASGVTAAALISACVAVASPSATGHNHSAALSSDGIVLRASIMPGISPGTSRPVRHTASNSGSSAVAIRIVRLIDVSADAGHPTCVTDDFAMADVAQDASVAGGARDHRLASGTLAYKSTDVDQGSCQGATLTLTLSSRGHA